MSQWKYLSRKEQAVILVLSVSCLCASFVIGFFISRVGNKPASPSPYDEYYSTLIEDDVVSDANHQTEAMNRLVQEISAENIRNYLG